MVDALAAHYEGTGVTVACSKCMDNCKQAANVRVQDHYGNETLLTGLSVDALGALLPGIRLPAAV